MLLKLATLGPRVWRASGNFDASAGNRPPNPWVLVNLSTRRRLFTFPQRLVLRTRFWYSYSTSRIDYEVLLDILALSLAVAFPRFAHHWH